ncbi:MAG: hypothetical protein KKD25_18945 [Gammaproteobacteria bacterium]|jgi:hypothetical protein|nr:hypothetical protein [Gammaproteobacteria bacterium]MBU0769932.1 hypothetical protein [Gammaproteobacteria bacterium]MBU0856263.1 hypothetical protein [Gammaproteobacteria bacterium]MBU1847784.1 hypothetical protein [Gammaproteobacteria bacterium]
MDRRDEGWQTGLPDDMKDSVVEPVSREAFHDDSVPASKWRGYDADGALCWYRHSFQLWEERFDDEDIPYMLQVASELLEVWRCLDGSWLRRQLRVGAQGACGKRVEDSGVERVAARDVPRL